MNYPQLKEYLKEQVLTIESEQITGLKAEFLTTQGLTASQELTEVLTRFYQSLVATINQDNIYHQLPKYKNLFSLLGDSNYFTTHKPNLGLKSESGIETAIDDQHYQLLDQVIVDYQASLSDDEDEEENPLTKQAQTINEKISNLLQEEENEAKQTKLIKKILTNCLEGQVILQEIKTWLTAYQQLSDSEKGELPIEFFDNFDAIDQAQVKEKDNKETTSKDEPIKNKEELLYFGGTIILIGVLAWLFGKKS